MNTSQLDLLRKPTPEQQVAEILRLARARYGRNLKPFYDQLLARQPKPKTEDFADLVAIARHRKQHG
jgi:hypothetical protein